MKRLLAVFLLFPLSFGGACAKGIFDNGDSEEAAKPVQEAPVVLPAFPSQDRLLPFPGGPVATQSFAIDPASLSLVSDEIRYTLVTTSKSGAQNISYEGIRCASFEMRRYAFGHKDEKWSLSQSGKWQPISLGSANRPQAILAQDYFCKGLTIAGKPGQMLDRIRYNRPLTDDSYKSN